MTQSMDNWLEDPNDPGTFIFRQITIPDNMVQTGYVPPYNLPRTNLVWGSVGERFFEAGIDRGVLYPTDMPGVVWNGLVSVSDSPSGGEAVPYYIDGRKYASPSAPEEWEATLEAYTYPDEFMLCDGSASIANGLYLTQQARKSFGLSYRTRIGNDVDGTNHGYQLHIVYNAQAAPTEKAYSTFSDETEVATFSWGLTARPKRFEDPFFGVKYGAHLILDSRRVYPWALEAIERVLYGTADVKAKLPEPNELLALMVDNALLKITDNGDGTWTAVGPDEAIVMLTSDEFQITWPSAVPIDNKSYTISSQ